MYPETTAVAAIESPKSKIKKENPLAKLEILNVGRQITFQAPIELRLLVSTPRELPASLLPPWPDAAFNFSCNSTNSLLSCSDNVPCLFQVPTAELWLVRV